MAAKAWPRRPFRAARSHRCHLCVPWPSESFWQWLRPLLLYPLSFATGRAARRLHNVSVVSPPLVVNCVLLTGESCRAQAAVTPSIVPVHHEQTQHRSFPCVDLRHTHHYLLLLGHTLQPCVAQPASACWPGRTRWQHWQCGAFDRHLERPRVCQLESENRLQARLADTARP